MVKSYTRFEPDKVFGVISGSSNLVWIAPGPSSSSTSAGRAIVGGLEHVLVWDIKTATLLHKWGTDDDKQCCRVAYEPEHGLVAAGYTDGAIRIWDVQSGEMLIAFNGHKSAVSCMVFDKEGTRLVSGSKDSDLIVWDLVSEVGLYRLRSHRDMVTQVLFVDEYLVSVSKEGLVKLWDLDTQHCVETHVSHRGECWSADYQDGVLLTTGNDNEVKVWSLGLEREMGERLQLEGTLHKSSASRGVEVKFTQGYFGIANADKSLEVWKIKSEEQIKKSVVRKQKRQREKGHEDVTVSENDVDERFSQYTVVRTPAKITSFGWAQGKKNELEIVTNLNNNSIQTFSVITGSKKSTAPADYQRVYGIELQGHRTDIRALSLSSDQKLVASASNGLLNVWNVKTTSCLRTFKCGYALCASFLPGDALIVCGTKAGKLELFDVASASLLEEIDAHDGELWSLQVSSDGKTMVSGGSDKTLKFWEFKVSQETVPGTTRTVAQMKLKHRRTLDVGEDILSVRLSPCGKYVACSLIDYTVRVFFVDTLKYFLKLYGHKLPVLSMDISSDSKLLVTCSADKNIKIWGLDFGDCHKSIFAHDDSIMGVQFEPGSHNFMSVAKDNQVKYWDGDKFVQIQKFAPPHHGEVWAVAVAHDLVVTASHDKSIRVWRQFDEPLFIEEERENELEQQHESTLLDDGLNNNDNDNDGNDGEGDEKERAGKQTIETLKAGERLMDALDIAQADVAQLRDHEQQGNRGAAQRHVVLATLNVSAEQHVMNVLSKIRPAQLEDALLVLPFDKVVALLEFVDLWTRQEHFSPQVALTCRVLFFVLKTHHKQIVAHHTMRDMVQRVRDQLRAGLRLHRDTIGYNTAGLQHIKQQWKQSHESQFVDEHEYAQQQDRLTKKRAFTTTV